MLTLTRVLNASSVLPFAHNQRGLSGSSQTPTNWMLGIAAWSATGILHDASEVYLIVPKTVHAAIIEPTYHSVLYMVVNVPRCWGCASSVTSKGAAPWLIFDLSQLVHFVYGMSPRWMCYPRPTKNLPAMNMPRFTDGADWTMTPTKSTIVPSDTHARRPSKSARYEAVILQNC